MTLSLDRDWMQLAIGFWSGVAVLSLMNIAEHIFDHNLLLYNEYMLVIATVILVIVLILRRSKR